jgi:hypothetical protein
MSLPPINGYGRVLPQSAFCGAAYFGGGDWIDPGSFPVAGATEAFLTINNASSLNSVSDGYSNENNETAYSCLVEANPASNIDYTASTLAVQSKCTPVTQKCGGSLDFNCSAQFAGNLPYTVARLSECQLLDDRIIKVWQTAVQLDVSDSDNYTNQFDVYSNETNPFYLVIAAITTNTGIIFDNPEVVIWQPNIMNESFFVMSCQMCILNLTYVSLNGSFHNINSSLASSDIATAAAYAFGVGFQNVAPLNILSAVQVAALSSMLQGIADELALRLNATSLGLLAGVVEPSSNLRGAKSRAIRRCADSENIPLCPYRVDHHIRALRLLRWCRLSQQQPISVTQCATTSERSQPSL